MTPSKSYAAVQPDFHKSLTVNAMGFEPVSVGTPWVGPQDASTAVGHGLEIAIVDDRSLMRDCFARSLSLLEPSLEFRSFSSIDHFLGAAPSEVEAIRVVVMCSIWSKAQSDEHFAKLSRLKSAAPHVEVVLLADIEDPADLLKAIELGARGNIPTNVSLEVAVKAMELVAAGGIYIPESVLVWSDQIMKEKSQYTNVKKQTDEVFTSRQIAVIDALRRGKANKIIAYELNMCESTVKVHIRNIMKKLKAKNRTEVAFKLNNMIFQNTNPLRN